MSEGAIVAALMEENASRCSPPLPEEEVRRVAASVSAYEPADPVAPVPSAEEISAAQQIVQEMLQRAKEDPGAPFEMKAVRALHLLRQAVPADYERARSALGQAHVRLRRLEAEINKLEPSTEEADVSTEAGMIVALVEDIELFHTPDGEGFATFPVGHHRETWSVHSRDFRRWLVKRFYKKNRRPPKSNALTDALCLLEARAQFEGEEYPVHVRVGGDTQRVVIDLGGPDWDAVEITCNGVTVVPHGEVHFRRAKGFLRLPAPTEAGQINVLRRFLNLRDEDDWRLVVVFLTNAMRPRGPYPVLALHGEQGSAKSTNARVLRAVLDPNTSPLRSEPRNEHELMIAASNAWIACLDNLSRLPGWLSDAICRLATGGGFSARTLYTDNEETLFEAQRPIILTGIEELASRGDLLERSLILYLPAIPEEKRLREETFWSEFNEAHPSILAGLLETVSQAMRELPSISLARLHRMADFAVWGVAVERALSWPEGSFLRAYEGNRGSANELVVEATSLGPIIIDLATQRGFWEGSASDLLALLLKDEDPQRRREPWARNPKALSNALRRLVPNLRALGTEVQFLRRHGRRLIAVEARSAAAPQAPASQVAHSKDLGGACPQTSRGTQDPGQAPSGTQSIMPKANTGNDLAPSGACGACGDGTSEGPYKAPIPPEHLRERGVL